MLFFTGKFGSSLERSKAVVPEATKVAEGYVWEQRRAAALAPCKIWKAEMVVTQHFFHFPKYEPL